jgi:17beta-estradiol 17-dehydrogenase / very-long-chain 3-oxoacyl-CoA reductase
MSIRKRYKARWAIITGASDGIGEHLAYQLSDEGIHLILVARNQDKLDRVHRNIIERHLGKVLVKTVVYDFSKLTSPEEAEEFERYISMFTYENDVGIIVNNVGRCWKGKFHE